MILIWSTQSPIGNANARETLDTALAFAAYDQPVALLFSDLGVKQLAPQPNAKQAGSKEIAKLIKALPLYDIEQIFICQKSAKRFDLSEEVLAVPAQTVTAKEIAKLCQEADHVIRI